MRKALVLCAVLALCATSAYAVGVDITAVACPTNAGAAGEIASFDCSAGDVLQLFCVFQPNEAIDDLVGIDCVAEVAVNDDMATNASFWSFGYANPLGIGFSHVCPATGCAGYLPTWSEDGSAEAIAYAARSPQIMRIGIVCYRVTPLSVTWNEKLFGYALTIDTGTSAEFNGGVGPQGCSTVPATLVIVASPATASGAQTTTLTNGSQALNCIQIGTSGTDAGPFCGVVPVQRHTWGRLKSLYR